MNHLENTFSLVVGETKEVCPIGENIEMRNRTGRKIPIISCEGACIKSEIARLAANMIAKEEPFRCGCHGEIRN
jgi:hypothetical protein